MLGAIAGDMIGSAFRTKPVKTTSFPLFGRDSTFTADTVCTVALAHALLEGNELGGLCPDYAAALRLFGRRYPAVGYDSHFYNWLFRDSASPYRGLDNASAVRASPVGHALSTVDEVLDQAAKGAAVTHNHPEGVKGAQAVALAVFLARTGESKTVIRREIAALFDIDLDRTLNDVRETYIFDASCQGSVPESLIAFLESLDFEDAVRKAISLGGDSGSMAAITGAVAEAFYGEIPEKIRWRVRQSLPETLLDVVDAFSARYGR